ncbi:hypothetical protein C8Q80DRAFT_1208455 [Daedaleopsis nitida]|nr:hypothetical protein C8Q80DRAFT_1208455 [Daedaleopsis nitida]
MDQENGPICTCHISPPTTLSLTAGSGPDAPDTSTTKAQSGTSGNSCGPSGGASSESKSVELIMDQPCPCCRGQPRRP